MIIISKNTIWKAGSEIHLADDVQVAPGVALTIEAGAKVFGGGHSVTAFGNLIADGSEAKPIVIQGLNLKIGRSDQGAKINFDNVFFEYGSISSYYKVNFIITNSTFNVIDDLDLDGMSGKNILKNNVFHNMPNINIGLDSGLIDIVHNYFDTSYGSRLKIAHNPNASATSRDNIFLGQNDSPKVELGGSSTLTSIRDYFGTDTMKGVNKFIYDRNDNLEISNYVKLQSTVLSLPVWTPTMFKTYSIFEVNLIGLAVRNGQALGERSVGLVGNEYDNKLVGNSGNNHFWESEGNDTYIGGKGNDFYNINSSRDIVIENKGEGYDTVRTSTTYALRAGQEIELLYIGGATELSNPKLNGAAINLYGNEFGQTIIGGSGNNVIDGRGGVDVMQGLEGNDTYFVDNAKDVVAEANNGGHDTIVTTVSYALTADQAVETLKFARTVGAAALNLSGNEFANTLVGSAGNNVLNGGGGADAMYGGIGDDTYVVDNANDKVSEARGGGTDTVLSSVGYALKVGQEIESLRLTGKAGSVDLTGNEFDQTLVGNVGANVLDGRLGADVLTGGKGADTFVFATVLGAGNVDRITDFSTVDTIRLSKGIFSALAPGELKAGEFKDIAKGKVDADDHILYDSRDGSLFYDADGSGKAAAVKFAVLDNKAALTHADFWVV